VAMRTRLPVAFEREATWLTQTTTPFFWIS
jgi:hypothetical protein